MKHLCHTSDGVPPTEVRDPARTPTVVRLAATSFVAMVAFGLAGCGAGDAQLDPTAAPATGTPVLPTAPTDPATGQPPDGSGNSGNSGSGDGGSGDGGSGNGSSGNGGAGDSGSGDSGGQAEQPSGPPPRITYPDVQAYVSGDDLVAEAYGHAFDDDGPDPQLRVARVEVQWGDGTATTAQLEGHGAFRDHHDYDSSYRGRTVTVRIVAYGHDGQTASEVVTVDLP